MLLLLLSLQATELVGVVSGVGVPLPDGQVHHDGVAVRPRRRLRGRRGGRRRRRRPQLGRGQLRLHLPARPVQVQQLGLRPVHVALRRHRGLFRRFRSVRSLLFFFFFSLLFLLLFPSFLSSPFDPQPVKPTIFFQRSYFINPYLTQPNLTQPNLT